MGNDNVIPIRPLKVVGEAGGLIDETHVTLAVLGDDLDPDEISTLLRCKPTSAHRRGDPTPRSGRSYAKGAWLVSMRGKAPIEPEQLLTALLAMLPSDPAVWDGLRQRFTVQLLFGLFLGAWNRGFDLSPAVLERVLKIGTPLGFDIYV